MPASVDVVGTSTLIRSVRRKRRSAVGIGWLPVVTLRRSTTAPFATGDGASDTRTDSMAPSDAAVPFARICT